MGALRSAQRKWLRQSSILRGPIRVVLTWPITWLGSMVGWYRTAVGMRWKGFSRPYLPSSGWCWVLGCRSRVVVVMVVVGYVVFYLGGGHMLALLRCVLRRSVCDRMLTATRRPILGHFGAGACRLVYCLTDTAGPSADGWWSFMNHTKIHDSSACIVCCTLVVQ